MVPANQKDAEKKLGNYLESNFKETFWLGSAVSGLFL